MNCLSINSTLEVQDSKGALGCTPVFAGVAVMIIPKIIFQAQGKRESDKKMGETRNGGEMCPFSLEMCVV